MPQLREPGCDILSPTWNVVHVRSGRELVAAALIEQYFHLVVHPLEVLQRRRGKLAPEPLFPGYILVALNGGHLQIDAIEAVPGCGRLVRSGRLASDGPGEPVQIGGAEAARLIERIAAINAAGGLPAHNLHPGQPVRLVRGPLQGLDAVFVGPITPAARVQVLLQFLGRQQQLSVEVNDIEPATPLKRPRRTRGQGRRIAP